MDIFDGFCGDDISKGVYEHITKKWLKALNLVPFATLWEWSLQSIASVFAIAISPQLVGISQFQGWLITWLIYLAVWFFSTVYEFYRTVPRRWKREEEALQKAGLKPKYKRRMAVRDE